MLSRETIELLIHSNNVKLSGLYWLRQTFPDSNTNYSVEINIVRLNTYILKLKLKDIK